MPTPADRLNFARFKRYVQRTWQRGVKPENLTVFESDHTTSNGCETFHAKLKAWIVKHRPNFWEFMLDFFRILEYYYKQYLRWLDDGPENLTRQNPEAKKNLGLSENLRFSKFTTF